MESQICSINNNNILLLFLIHLKINYILFDVSNAQMDICLDIDDDFVYYLDDDSNDDSNDDFNEKEEKIKSAFHY